MPGEKLNILTSKSLRAFVVFNNYPYPHFRHQKPASNCSFSSFQVPLPAEKHARKTSKDVCFSLIRETGERKAISAQLI